MKHFKWKTVLILHVEKTYNNKKRIEVDREEIIVQKKLNKYQEIISGIKLKALDIDIQYLKSAYFLRTDHFVDVFYEYNILDQLDEVGIYLCIEKEEKIREEALTTTNIKEYIDSFENSKFNKYLKLKEQRKQENNCDNIKRLIKENKFD